MYSWSLLSSRHFSRTTMSGRVLRAAAWVYSMSNLPSRILLRKRHRTYQLSRKEILPSRHYRPPHMSARDLQQGFRTAECGAM